MNGPVNATSYRPAASAWAGVIRQSGRKTSRPRWHASCLCCGGGLVAALDKDGTAIDKELTAPRPMNGGWKTAGQDLGALISTPGLDACAKRDPALLAPLLRALDEAAAYAWAAGTPAGDACLDEARLFCHRALYQLNRLRLYWFDSPAAYVNERSRVLLDLQDRIEEPWQAWLDARVAVGDDALAAPLDTLRAWVARDLEAADTPEYRFFAQDIDLEGYKRLLQIGSLNGLVEASQLSRTLGGYAGGVQCMLTRILFEEYGGGRPQRKHSTFFAAMLEEIGLSATPEAYLDTVPWEVLAAINHAFYLAENKRFFVRFCGAFTYTEVSTPVSFRGYAAAARRLGLSDGERDYWSLHIREDERHGRWMVDEVAAPLLERFPAQRGDFLAGYAQQRIVEGDAAAATLQACRDATLREAAA